MIIGIDAGGTHTDGVLLSKEGIESKNKVLSTPNSFESTKEVLNPLKENPKFDSEKLDRLMIGTTLIV